ncbi:MAG: spermidine synthase [Acidobacteriota bacterium]|jgi:spermidine synthase|nr:spermidine synthase [Acidobacteriota bacterium]
MSAVSAQLPVRKSLRAYSKSSLWLIGLCFVLSGATGLIYEVLWARMLGLVFGATTFAISAVLAAFMGGLALGSAWAGKLAGRIKRPLRAYGLIEIGIAVYAISVPLLFRWVDYLYAFIWEQFRPGFYAFSLWRFALSCLVLLVPTTLMGATLPVLSAALLRTPNHKPTAVTRLYTCNLIGAIFGTVVAGFYLLPTLGVRLTIFIAAAINFVVGLFAILIDRRDERNPAREETVGIDRRDAESPALEEMAGEAKALEEEDVQVNGAAEPPSSLHPNPQSAIRDPRSQRFWLLCAAISGFVTISTQVAWTRVLTMIIGSSTYAFSIVVALFLLGLASGAYIVARKKMTANLRRSVMNVELATAATLLVSIWMTNATPSLLVELGTNLQLNSWLGLLMLQVLIAAMLILVPAILMGMVMPLVLVWASSTGNDASVRKVGRSYAVNTLGAIAGAFSTGFILIPKVSTRFTILFAATLCLILAGLAYRPTREDRDPDLRRSFTAGATAALIVLLFVVAPNMKLGSLSIGAYDTLVRVLAKSRGSASDSETATPGPDIHRLLLYREGPTATVSVRDDWGIRSMAINGRTNASDRDDMPTQVILGQLPLLIAPRMESGLIVGFGSGVSVGSMLQSEIKSLECVELEPTAIEAGAFFNHVNNQPLDDPRLRLIIDDARTYLRVNPTRYDMIVSEPSHPWVPGVANLFTQEFFELGRSRLKDDGVFVQWVQIYQLSTESLRSVLATYKSVFPHVLMFRVQGAAKGKDLILVGSRQPLTLDRVAERMQDGRMAKELARININAPADLESWFVCDETQLAPAVDGAVINTDDNMRVENRAPREAFLPVIEANAAWIENLAALSRNARNQAGVEKNSN